MTKTTEHQIKAAQQLLAWYVAMGVDCSVGETSIDWRGRTPTRQPAGLQIGRPNAPPQRANTNAPGAQDHRPGLGAAPSTEGQRHSPATTTGRFAAAHPPDEAELLARTQAQDAQSLNELEQILRAFDGCGLKVTAKNLCFYRGSPKAPIAIIGEAPGRDEDIAGKPFVGRAGQLLDKMLTSIGLGEDDVHITNIVYWRPPGNRTPTPLEAQICRPFLMRQMELLNPKMVLVLGGAAAKNILEVSDGIMRLRGKWRTWNIGERSVPLMASLHPAYLLRTPAAKRLAWRDLRAIQEARQTW